MIPPFPRGEGLPARRLKICIVTFELVGLWKNGGIGTVSTGLAELLAAAGHAVTVAYTRAELLTDAEFTEASERYRRQGIEVVALRRRDTPPVIGPLAGFTGWERFAAYHFLRGRDFDVVHGSEHLGELFYAIAAKRLGTDFAHTAFWVGCHGPSQWVIEANDDVVRDPFWLFTDASERFCLRHADVVWAPSRYMLGWLRESDFALPNNSVFQQQYRIPDDLGPIRAGAAARRAARRPVEELVLFGRLETRKGVKLFLDALEALGAEARPLRISLMGRVGAIDGEPADTYIARRAEQLGLSCQILSGFDRFEAYDYVTQPGRLVVAAAPVDNSPCAVYELLEVGAHFIACRGGGVPELIAEECHAETLFDYTIGALAGRLRHCLAEGSGAPTPAISRAQAEAAWLGAHLALTSPDKGPSPLEEPTAATALVQYEGDLGALAATVESLRACGSLVREILLLQSDRRGVLSDRILPELRRLSLETIGLDGVVATLAANGTPALILKAGATVDADNLGRLTRGVARADAVVPSISRDGAVDLALPGTKAWAMLYATAATTGLLAADALRRLDATGVSGSDALLLFELALAQGMTVLPMVEAVVDGSGVERSLHYVPDERARLTFWTRRAPAPLRILLETAYGRVVREPPAPAAVAPVPPAAPPPPGDALDRFEALRGSRSFRYGDRMARLLGAPPTPSATPQTERELELAEAALRASFAWCVGAPLRSVGRRLRGWRRG